MNGNQKLLEHWRVTGLLSKTSERFWQKNIKKYKLNYEYIFAKAYLKELTDWDKDISLKVRLTYLKHNITQKSSTCFCGEKKKRKSTSFKFTLTCGKKDKEHLEFINSHARNTKIKNFGVPYTKQIKYNLENYNSLSKELIEEKFITKEGYIKVKEFQKFINCGQITVFKICQKFKVLYNPRRGRSRVEDEIISFVKKLIPDIKIQKNNKKILSGKELDIYLPEYNLAVEYNGLAWHSHGVSDHKRFHKPEVKPNRHLDKTKECEEKGIDLIQIFEDIYTTDLEEIELLLQRKLGLVKWSQDSKEIVWSKNYGKVPEIILKNYNVVKIKGPTIRYFYKNTPYKTSVWSQWKTDREVFTNGYRKYYDCGSIELEQK